MQKKPLLSVTVLVLFFSAVVAQNADINLLRKINLGRNKSLDPVFKTFTYSAAPVSIGLPIIMYSSSLINRDKDLQRQSVFVGTSLILAISVSSSLKYCVNRKRPFVTYPDIDKETSAGNYSFPSGHSTVAFATATSFSLAYPKWYVIAPAFVWAGAISYSRMHLGVHYPSDVLIGALIGIGSSLLCYSVNQNIH